tara:strand:+ start:94 stop:555 length:462 start_codon:yes stop_codon:yes gene_type:complete
MSSFNNDLKHILSKEISMKGENKGSLNNNISDVLNLIENERINHKNDKWNKLSINNKSELLNQFISSECIKNKLNNEEEHRLSTLLFNALNEGRLNKKIDIKYNVKDMVLEEINILKYNSENKEYTIKNNDNKINKINKSKSNIGRLIKNKRN